MRRLIDSVWDRRLAKVPLLALSEAEKLAICQNHGDFSLAYSTAVQEGLKHFGDSRGYLAYATKMGHTFVLGDPVAPKAERRRYIEDFLAASGSPCFVQIGAETASVLAEHGYRINHMGVDTVLAFERHSFAGKRNETLRYSERWLLKQGYSLAECDGSRADAAELDALSRSWRAERIVSRREMCFLNRPFLARLAAGMRRFVLTSPLGQTVAVLDFDPIHTDGAVTGYTTAFKRKLPGTTPHAEIGLTKFAADRFREEGRSHVTLGLSPLAALGESGHAESRIWRKLFEFAYLSKSVNSRIFNLQGQAAFKRRFHGEEVATYIAFKRRTPVEMLALLRLLKTL